MTRKKFMQARKRKALEKKQIKQEVSHLPVDTPSNFKLLTLSQVSRWYR